MLNNHVKLYFLHSLPSHGYIRIWKRAGLTNCKTRRAVGASSSAIARRFFYFSLQSEKLGVLSKTTIFLREISSAKRHSHTPGFRFFSFWHGETGRYLLALCVHPLNKPHNPFISLCTQISPCLLVPFCFQLLHFAKNLHLLFYDFQKIILSFSYCMLLAHCVLQSWLLRLIIITKKVMLKRKQCFAFLMSLCGLGLAHCARKVCLNYDFCPFFFSFFESPRTRSFFQFSTMAKSRWSRE